MKTILVPTDFSAESDAAIEVAVRLARKMGTAIRLLHVAQDFNLVDPTAPFAISAPVAFTDLTEEARRILDRKARGKIFEGLPVSYEVMRGELINRMKDAIKEVQPELMVVGTKGAEGMYELFIGSHAEKIVRFAGCPVLTVRSKAEDFELRNVLLAANFDDDCSKLVTRLKAWQEIFGFWIHVVHINTPLNYNTTFQLEELMEKFIEKYQLKNYTRTILDDYSQGEGIMSFANKIEADVIALATHGRKGVSLFLDGSVAEEVVNHARQPVLTMHL